MKKEKAFNLNLLEHALCNEIINQNLCEFNDFYTDCEKCMRKYSKLVYDNNKRNKIEVKNE